MDAFGDCLRAARTRSKLSQAEFGKILGLPSSVISRYENNINVPNLITFISMCNELNVSANELLMMRTQASHLEERISALSTQQRKYLDGIIKVFEDE